MACYQVLCRFDQTRTFVDDFRKVEGQEKIADYIHKNIDRMDDVEKRHLLARLLDDRRVGMELSRFELRYRDTGERISDLPTYISFIDKTFARYHLTAGGHLCEDTDWTKYDTTSTKYPLKPNEVIFENSIKRVNRNDTHVIAYIRDLLRFFRRHRVKPVRISFRLLEATDEIYWMIFKVTDRTKSKGSGSGSPGPASGSASGSGSGSASGSGSGSASGSVSGPASDPASDQPSGPISEPATKS